MATFRWVIATCVLIASHGVIAASTSLQLEHTRDYIAVADTKATLAPRISFPGATCTNCWGDAVTYTTFSTPVQTYAARRYDGRHITLIVPQSHPREAEVTEDRLRVLVDRLDILYVSYRDLLGWEPTKTSDPLGKQVFAFLPNDPAGFYGIAFAPGDSSEYINAVLEERAPDDDILSNVWVHELAHNFDMISVWDYGPDPGHDWTTILQGWFARRQSHMDEVNRTGWRAYEALLLTLAWNGYRNSAAVTWEQCAATSPRPQACVNASAYFLAGNLAMEFGQHATGEQMRNWLRQALAAQNRGVNLIGPQARSDFTLATLANATQTDTRCIASRFRWYQGSGLATAAQYPNLFPGCLDGDGDGASRFDDCNEGNPSIRPGAIEVSDGRDNNCDGQVDESRLAEPAVATGDFSNSVFIGAPAIGAAPLEIAGGFTEGAGDSVDFINLSSPIDRVSMRLCATGARTLVAGLATNGIGFGPLLGANPGGCAETALWGQNWQGFWLARDNSSTAPATYTLQIGLPISSGWPHPPAVKLVRSSTGAVQAQLDAGVVQGGVAGAEVRWFQTGVGEIKRGAATLPTSLDAPVLTSSAFVGNRPVQLRAQLWRDDMPIEEPSSPYLFPTSGELNAVVPGAQHSGAWYSRRHNGEGFLIEMLPSGRFLAYWFTYDPGAWNSPAGSAAQHWMLADGVVDGSVLRAPVLRVSGGRFGSAMNPAELLVATVGELEIVFGGDDRGSVHYRIDGRTGEHELERLTRFRTGPGARGLSGSWYQGSLAGQGLVVQETSTDEIVAIMFTFDAQRRPAWALMQGTIASNGAIAFAAAPFRASGGLFGRGYRNSTIVVDVAGSASMSLGCTEGSFTIQLPGISGSAQSLTLERLTRPLGVSCPTTVDR